MRFGDEEPDGFRCIGIGDGGVLRNMAIGDGELCRNTGVGDGELRRNIGAGDGEFRRVLPAPESNVGEELRLNAFLANENMGGALRFPNADGGER